MSREVTTDTWRLADIPDQAGRTIVVTGPSVGGLGHATALELARRGARVVLAGRTRAKLDEARDAIEAEVPGADLEEML
ncbi:SDR family NAD(P)-dependent oxidoreductase, partial [Nocardioides salarius]